MVKLGECFTLEFYRRQPNARVARRMAGLNRRYGIVQHPDEKSLQKEGLIGNFIGELPLTEDGREHVISVNYACRRLSDDELTSATIQYNYLQLFSSDPATPDLINGVAKHPYVQEVAEIYRKKRLIRRLLSLKPEAPQSI